MLLAISTMVSAVLLSLFLVSQFRSLIDGWKVGVEILYENNRSSDEEKYIDLLESLKKNEVIKDFVVNTLVEKVRTTRTETRML